MKQWDDNNSNEKANEVSDSIVCPRCDNPVKPREQQSARIDGEISHIECALEEIDEAGMDDFHG